MKVKSFINEYKDLVEKYGLIVDFNYNVQNNCIDYCLTEIHFFDKWLEQYFQQLSTLVKAIK